ncbi:MAG: HDOD domain-containing protein [Phycisphaerae bacterium]
MTSRGPKLTQPQRIELVLAQLESIPPLAPIAAKILSLTDDPTSHARQIVELIAADPALTARILSIINRAEHGVRSEVVDIDSAIRMLGFNAVRRVTLTLKVMDVFGPAGASDAGPTFDRAEFWKHCLVVGCAARRLAAEIRAPVTPEDAFVCGLLHDIGKIALQTALPKSYDRIVRTANADRSDIADAERAVLGVDHTAIGHRLAERWGLPGRLRESIRLHHQPPEALPPSIRAGRHVQIVQLADLIAREQHIGYSGNHRMPIGSRELSERLEIPADVCRGVAEALPEEIEQRAVWIGIEDVGALQVYLRALSQATEELTAVNAELSDQNKRLARQADYFAALRALNQAVSPRASVREACMAGASALRRALSVPVVLVFVTSGDGCWFEYGHCGDERKSGIEPRPPDAPDESADAAAAVSFAHSGTWIAPPGPAFRPLVDRYRGVLGPGPTWLLPLVREQRWVGGALFAAPPERAAAIRMEATEIEALSAAIGLAIAQAQAQFSAAALGDELVEVNRHLVATQNELLEAKTLKTIVAMAAGAAHELNNPLAVIAGRAQALRAQAQDADVREALDAVLKQAHVCSDIVSELMGFARSSAPRPERVALPAVFESLKTELLSDGLLEGGILDIAVASDTPPVHFDRGHLTGLLREILRNGIEATAPQARRLTVKARRDLAEECVVVTVADNGRGMTKEVHARALDPFFSSRPAGRGRGLGLARVHRWLQQGGGTIRIDTEPGRSTCVELRLPVAPMNDR